MGVHNANRLYQGGMSKYKSYDKCTYIYIYKIQIIRGRVYHNIMILVWIE